MAEHDTRKGVRSNCWKNPGYAKSPLGGWPDLPRCPACEPATEQRVCTCPVRLPAGPPYHHHMSDCPLNPSQWDRVADSVSAIVVKPGDKVLLCFAGENYSDHDMDNVLALLKRKMLGIEWGYVTGVSGVLIQRGNDNDSDRSTDDT